ncbi:Sal-like protein 4 [Fukomys damarensis]|uniref:Sal-like protein 4 n=1 Tax=Fukomys damarensis TaxID=885580 RepID=A0A091CT49_FUKDA|nr:Sal-like protein 4 [Fukomys damarensis]
MNFSSASALQIHRQIQTGEKPFDCNICRQVFTPYGNLKVRYMTQGANDNSVHCRRKLAIENTMALFGTDGKSLRNVSQGDPDPLGVDSVEWTQYTTMLNGGLTMKTDKSHVVVLLMLSVCEKLKFECTPTNNKCPNPN